IRARAKNNARRKFPSGLESLKPSRIPNLLKVAGPKLDDTISDDHRHHEVNAAGRPLRERAEFAGAFVLIITVEPPQSVLKFSADFARGVLVGKEFGKPRGGTEGFSGRPAAVDERTPGQHRPPQGR